MSPVYHLHPEFGLLCPSRRVRRTARVALAFLACSVIVGTLAVNPGLDGTLIIAHDDVAPTNADTVQTVAQATATTIAESAPALEGSAQACEGDLSNQRCSVGRARKPLSPRAANEAPMIAALPLGRTTARYRCHLRHPSIPRTLQVRSYRRRQSRTRMKPPPRRPRRCENPRARMVATVCRATGDGAMINGALALTPCPTTATCAVHTNGRGAGPGEVC